MAENAVLIIGGGIAGIQAALDLADQNIQAYLVEKKPSVGGHMAMFDKTFPTLDCSACILTPKMVELEKNPNIHLYTYSEVIGIEGSIGNFKVKIIQKPRYVQEDKCKSCGDCADICPIEVGNEFDRGFGIRKAIYIPFSQAIPLVYTIDKDSCINCKLCSNVCKAKAIDYDQEPQIIELNVSAIILATGYDLFDVNFKKAYSNYGYGKYSNVITTLDFERFLNVTGPSCGHPIRLSEGKIPKKIAFIQCVGSRDPNQGKAYCSRICCMASIKQAILAKEHIIDCDSYVFYIDLRTFGKGYEEFFNLAKERYGINFIRGKVSEIIEDSKTKNLIIKVENTELGEFINIDVDLVILSAGTVISNGSIQIREILENKFQIPIIDNDGFFIQLHPEVSSTETNIPGILATGFAVGPRDIPDTVAYSSAAVTKAALIAKGENRFE